jgi:uncharacterized protein YraI
MPRYLLYLAASLAASASLSATASADTARVTANLHMRAGPSTEFPVVTTVSDGARVEVHGCVSGYSWCDVSWADSRGWVDATYLTYPYHNSYVPIVDYGSEIDLPIVVFEVGNYWDDYYRGRPWYHNRSHWLSVWNRDRVDNRPHRGAALHRGASVRTRHASHGGPRVGRPHVSRRAHIERGGIQHQAHGGPRVGGRHISRRAHIGQGGLRHHANRGGHRAISKSFSRSAHVGHGSVRHHAFTFGGGHRVTSHLGGGQRMGGGNRGGNAHVGGHRGGGGGGHNRRR